MFRPTFDYDAADVDLSYLHTCRNSSDFGQRWWIESHEKGIPELPFLAVCCRDDGLVKDYCIGVVTAFRYEDAEDTVMASVLWQDQDYGSEPNVIRATRLKKVIPRHQGVVCELSPDACEICATECGGECEAHFSETAQRPADFHTETYVYKSRTTLPESKFTPIGGYVRIGDGTLERQTFLKLLEIYKAPDLASMLNVSLEELCKVIIAESM